MILRVTLNCGMHKCHNEVITGKWFYVLPLSTIFYQTIQRCEKDSLLSGYVVLEIFDDIFLFFNNKFYNVTNRY
jgi:hypothetical protein